jgi:hypothetical protein
VCGLPTHTLSPSVQLARTATEQQSQHRKQTGRKGKLAEASQEDFKGRKKKKGEVKKTENDWWEGKRNEKRLKKDLITYVDKPTIRVR